MAGIKDTKPKSDPIQFKITEFLKPGIGTKYALYEERDLTSRI